MMTIAMMTVMMTKVSSYNDDDDRDDDNDSKFEGVVRLILDQHTPNIGPSWAQDGLSWTQVGIKFGQ
eukprot:202031-Karenia_brevis.AAC.1